MTGTWATGWATGDIVTAAEFKKAAGSVFDTTLGASAANVDVTSISATYAHLMISVYARGDAAATVSNLQLTFNGDGGANYDNQDLFGSAAVATAAEAFAGTSMFIGSIAANTAGANLFGTAEIFIPHYAGSSNNKQVVVINANKAGVASGNMLVGIFGSGWRSTAAINRVTLTLSAGNFVAGTRVTVHALGA